MSIHDPNQPMTVGIVTGCNSPPERIGTFTPAYLKEWAERLIQIYGADTEVKVDVRNVLYQDAQYLAASDDGEEPYVVVMGHVTIKRKE